MNFEYKQARLKYLFISLLIVISIGMEILFKVQFGDHGEEKLRWVVHTHEVILQTKDLLSALQDTETGQRGYLLTRDRDYLEPYYKGLEQVEKSYTKLKFLTIDNINQVQRLEKLLQDMDKKLEELQDTINAKRFEDALLIVKENKGKFYMDSIRTIIKDIIHEEELLLLKRHDELYVSHTQTLNIIRLIALIFLSGFMYFLYISVMQKNTLNKNLKDLHKKDEEMIRHTRLAQMGELISMIAHQWRQPLAAIASTSMDLRLKLELESFHQETQEGRAIAKEYFIYALEQVDSLILNLSNTVDDFRNFYKPNREKEKNIIGVPAQKAYKILKATLKEKSIVVKEDYKALDTLDMYPNELMQVVLNLLQNAKDSCLSHKVEHACISISTYDTKRGSIIEVSDNGNGIPKDILERIFDPYFSTKIDKNGTGLGLYMCQVIVEEHHNGVLSVKNTEEGACFSIELFH